MRVLLVEDEQIARTVICRHLVSMGHSVTVARDGREAIPLITLPFDIILLDINLPHVSGYELAKMIRDTETYPNFIVAISSNLEVLDGHFDLVHKKPITKDDLLTILKIGTDNDETPIDYERGSKTARGMPTADYG